MTILVENTFGPFDASDRSCQNQSTLLKFISRRVF